MMLKDLQTGDLYVQVSRELADELAEWSEPVQIRIENGYVMLRNLGQPVKGVYIVDDERQEKRA